MFGFLRRDDIERFDAKEFWKRAYERTSEGLNMSMKRNMAMSDALITIALRGDDRSREVARAALPNIDFGEDNEKAPPPEGSGASL